jgi:hypothetical protein
MTEQQIKNVRPGPESPWVIELSEEERDDLIAAVTSGSAEESWFEEHAGTARLQRRVTVELDGTFVCEEFPSIADAKARYQFTKQAVQATRAPRPRRKD